MKNVFERGRGVHEIKLHYLMEEAVQLLQQAIPLFWDEDKCQWAASSTKLIKDYESLIEEEEKQRSK